MKLVVGFDAKGNMRFASKSMEKTWNKVRGFYSRAGSYFTIEIGEVTKNSTEGQQKLFKRLCLMVSDDTGQDYIEVHKSFSKLTPFKDKTSLFGEIKERNLELNELNTKQFQDFLEKVLVDANNIMNTELILYHDEKFGTILTTKK